MGRCVDSSSNVIAISAPGDFEACSDFFEESTSIDRVVLISACWGMLREAGLLRARVDFTSPVPEFSIAKTVDAILDFVSMHLK